MSLFVVQMHGEPGSGKSTLARELGRRLDAIVLDKDVIKSALLREGLGQEPAAGGAYAVYFEVARAIVGQGCSLILDNPVFWESVERRWLEIAALAGSPPILVECFCPDRAELERRLATRQAMESQQRGPIDVARFDRRHRPVVFQPRLVVDTTRPLDELVQEAETYARAGVPA